MSSRESSLERDHAGREDSRGPFLQDVVILPVAVNQQPLERQDPIVNLEERSPPDILPVNLLFLKTLTDRTDNFAELSRQGHRVYSRHGRI